ncbi:MAG: glycosyltransferase [Candidatus Heimdallarchaeota archaeon]
MSHQESTDIEQPTVFEVSNEIANKIGGIYTVIASKAPEMPKMLGSGNYFAIGLYNSFKARNDFEELDPPEDFLEVFTKLRADGIEVKFGRWLGGGNVDTILVDPSNLLDFPIITGKDERRIDQIKGLLWDWYKIDSIWMPEVFDPMVAFGWATGRLISELITCSRFSNKKIVAHFHEWISGPGLLYLKKNNVEISTIFMTHATQLGRNIAMGEEDINEVVDKYLAMGETIPPQKAYQYQVEGTHQLEVVCASECDVLITVSEAIAKETECILGRKPDFVIPNGMNFNQITRREGLPAKHQSSRKTINQFIETYFNPYYTIDFEKLLVVHISGRYEFHNKGVDVFIEALQEVNEQLKTQQTSSKEILAYIWIPAPISGTKQFITKTFELSKTTSEPYREDGVVNPPISPFIINEKDTILCALKDAELFNKKDDRVKVIFYPTYLSKNDQLLGLDYYDAVSGCDMGIYPSTYEPFGLTPLEALALGVPAVTTDLSGFGLLINEQFNSKTNGIHVLERRGKSNSVAAKELAQIIIQHANMSDEAIQKAKTNARDISELYSWRNIIKEYLTSYNAAITMKK